MTDKQTAANDAEEIAHLAQLDPLEYERSRRVVAKLMRCRVAVLDQLVERARRDVRWAAYRATPAVPQQSGDPSQP
jgi:hypothetical protein